MFLATSDTVAVYGARTFATPTGSAANHVEQFTVTFEASTAYELRIEFGDASGANRPSVASVKLNGDVIATERDFPNGASTLQRRVEVGTTNVLEVTVQGGAGALIRTTLLAFSDGTMTIFGLSSYDAASNQLRTVSESFTLPAGALPPYRVHVLNGEPDGTLRASSATVRVNGEEVLGGRLMKDAFLRNVSQGWGSADVGGAWVPSSTNAFRVDGSSGIIEVSNNGPQIVVGSNLSTYGRDVEGLTSFSVNRAPDAADKFHTVQVYALRDDRVNFGHNYYRYRVRIFGNGTMDVRIEKSVGNSQSFVTEILPANLTFVAGAKYWIRWEAIGRSPAANVRMRVWRDGVSEPTTWHAAAVVNEPRLDAGGTTGFRFQGPSSSQVNWPVRLSVDDLQYSDRSAFNQNVAAGVREVPLTAQNQLNLTFTAPNSSRIKVRVSARDGVPPVLTVSAPAEATVIRETSILVSGTVVDATPTRVTIDGQAVALDGQGGFAAQIPLAAEGEKILAIVATDAAGNTSQIERRVIRDTAPPALSVTSPVDGSVTLSDSVLVAGTATDAGAVTVLANAYPLSVGAGGTFTGKLPLDVGLNTLVVSATDPAGNQTAVTLTVTRDTLAPQVTVIAPVNGASVATEQLTVSGTVTDATAVTVTVNGTSVAVASGGAFSTNIALVPGTNTIPVVATDAAGNVTTVERTVTRSDPAGDLPPDPSTVAPPLDPTVATNLATATSFLYSGPSPIQRDADSLAFLPVRAAVVRGHVLTRDGAPLPGARVSVKDHPEYGWTLSRADGMYDLAVNGGGTVTLDFEMFGYLHAQRQVAAEWQDYERVEDVALVRLDSIVTTIDLSAASVQVARGSVVTDSDGTRRATVLFEPGTSAELVLPDGSVVVASALSVRATEYTVGPNGPVAMPGPLPPQSAYTYAVELSADEAIAAGATSVRFNKPVAFYVENFLDLPVGTAVPLAFYDYARSAWIPEEDGVVVRVLSTAGGRATLDFNGDGIEDAEEMLEIGITEGERARIAELYQPGQTLWRTGLEHFSPCDLNMANLPREVRDSINDMVPPDNAKLTNNQLENETNKICRSIVECENQALGETLSLSGTPFVLSYRSHRTPGYTAGRTITIPLSGSSVSPSLQRIYLKVEIAGVLYEDTFPPLPNQNFTYTWDGRDAYGRAVQGRQGIAVAIGYEYPGSYITNPWTCMDDGDRRRFGLTFRCEESGTAPARVQVTRWQRFSIRAAEPGAIEAWDSRAQRLGGWSLDVQHSYDPVGGVLHMGNGTRRAGEDMNRVITSVAARDQRVCCTMTYWGEYNGDNQPAVDATLGAPWGIAVAPDGTYYIADTSNSRVRRVGTDGIITTVAGTGEDGFSSDEAPAVQSRLSSPRAVALGPDGVLYIADLWNHRIRSVGRDGIMRTVAGTATNGFSGDGGPATAAQLNEPHGVTVTADGTIYIADTWNHRIRRIGPDGIIRTVAGGETSGFTADGVPARGALLRTPDAIVAAEDGSVYFTDDGRVRRITPDGLLETIAGRGDCDVLGQNISCGDGGPALHANIHAHGIALGPDGSIYIAEYFELRQVTPDGIIRTITGDFVTCCGNLHISEVDRGLGDGGPAKAGWVKPQAMAFAPDGSLYVTDQFSRVRRIAPLLPGFSSADIAIASEDGSEIYQFDGGGRHLRTLDALTGTAHYTFGYDANGALVSILDADSLVTRIERDAAGTPSAVVGHYGQRTQLSIRADGFLASVIAPGNETVTLGYASGGLLTSLTDPRNNQKTYAYTAEGRLLSDSDAASGSVTLPRVLTELGTSTTVTTAMGRATTYTVERLPTGEEVRATINPSGLVTLTTESPDGTILTVGPDSTRMIVRATADPRFGMQSPLLAEARFTTPSGLESVIRSARKVTLANPSNPLSVVVSQIDSTIVNGTRVFTSTYDGATGTAVKRSPEGRQSTSLLDAKGRVVQTQVPGMAPTSYGYDADGRLRSVTQGSRTSTLTYDASGQLSSATDPLNRTSRNFYDASGRVTRQVLPDQREIHYGYDAAGNLTSLTPPSRPAHAFGYTPINLTERYTPPDVGSGATAIRYVYNRDRQLTRIERPDGLGIDFGYDTGGRLATATLPNGTYSYGYSPTKGNVASVTAPGGVGLTYSYDGGIRTSVRWTGPVSGSLAVTYDNNFQVTQQTVNGGHGVTFGYDGDGLLTSSGALSLSRNPQNGLLTGSTLGNTTSSVEYSPHGELASLIYAFGSTPQFQTSYTRDELGRITQLTETVLSVTSTFGYTYDAAGRVKELRKDGVPVESHGYDLNGNRLSLTTASGVTTGTYDEQDRVLSYGSTTYSYTANGELASKTTSAGTATFNYDVVGNLRTVTLPDGTTIDYVIDGQNRRVGRKVNGVLVQGLLYAGQLTPVAELDGSGNVVSRFIHATRVNVPDYMVKNGVTYRLITDHLGSVRLVVNTATGALAQRIDYDVLGRETQNTAPGFQPFGFAGGLYDGETKLLRFGARDYDAETGRWTTKDPILFGGSSSNLYEYAANDPVNLVDPAGETERPVNLGQGWTGNIHIYEYRGTVTHEIHVYDPSGREVGILGPNGWRRKHGHTAPPILPDDVANKLNGANIDELRREGVVLEKGRENIKHYKNRLNRMFGYVGLLLHFLDVYCANERAEQNGWSVWHQMLIDMGYITPVPPDRI